MIPSNVSTVTKEEEKEIKSWQLQFQPIFDKIQCFECITNRMSMYFTAVDEIKHIKLQCVTVRQQPLSTQLHCQFENSKEIQIESCLHGTRINQLKAITIHFISLKSCAKMREREKNQTEPTNGNIVICIHGVNSKHINQPTSQLTNQPSSSMRP